MTKTYKLILTLAVFATVSNLAFADGNAFTPLNFDDATSTPTNYSVPKEVPATPKASNPISNAISKVKPAKKDATSATPSTSVTDSDAKEAPIGNENIQNAILELDNAQVGIRNDLLNYRAKYADVDAQYKLIKNERTMLDKQVKSIEKRIKNIDRAKDRIRKNML